MDDVFFCTIVEDHLLFENFKFYIGKKDGYLSRSSSFGILAAVILLLIVLIGLLCLIKYLRQRFINSSAKVDICKWFFSYNDYCSFIFSHQKFLMIILLIQSKQIHYLVICMNNVMMTCRRINAPQNIHSMSM